MKILFIQLARLGDVLLTIPSIRALRKKFPDAQIDLLVRSKFASVARLFESELDNIIELDTKTILGPLLNDDVDLDQAFAEQEKFVNPMRGEYDSIVNFTYSPYSSYLSQAISSPGQEIIGYTRFPDGFLEIPDDLSAYIYAQVGPGMPNRYHLTDLFASAMQLDLEPEDFRIDTSSWPQIDLPNEYFVVHVGASQSIKSYPVSKWRIVIARILKDWGGKVILVGSAAEKDRASAIMEGFQGETIIDMVGETTIPQLFQIVEGAKILMGADSLPIHISTMVDTPVLNLSFSTVNFWETGPRSNGSRIVYANFPEELNSETVVFEAISMLRDDTETRAHALYRPGLPCYGSQRQLPLQWEWDFTNALYTGSDFPILEDKRVYEAMVKIYQANDLIIEELQRIVDGGDRQVAMQVIQRAEEVIAAIRNLVPQVSPLVSWMETQKHRIGPRPLDEVLSEYLSIHNSIKEVLDFYVDPAILEELNNDPKPVLK